MTQFNFKLYTSNLLDSSSAIKAYKNTLQQSCVQEFKHKRVHIMRKQLTIKKQSITFLKY